MTGGSDEKKTTSQYKHFQAAPGVPSSTSSHNKPKIICRYCKEPNHVVKDCILVKKKEKQKQKQVQATHHELTAECPEEDSENE